MDLIKIAEEAFATPKKNFDEFGPGDTITVAYRIKEGNKERIQQYRGVVIRINGHQDKKRFTVRKISDGIGVERIFPMESPFIESITVNKYGKVRRAKLYYLRLNTYKRQKLRFPPLFSYPDEKTAIVHRITHYGFVYCRKFLLINILIIPNNFINLPQISKLKLNN